MRYSIRHITRFTYESPITESVMEARMQARTDTLQRCLQFTLLTTPSARVMTYRDHDNNLVHHTSTSPAVIRVSLSQLKHSSSA